MNTKQFISINYIVLILAAAFFSALLSIYPIALIPLVILLSVFFVGYLLVKRPDRTVPLLILLIIFQNFIAIILAKQAGGTAPQVFILIKELLLYSALTLAFVLNFRKLKLTSVDVLAVLYLGILGIYLVFPTETPLFVKTVQFRQLITPVALFLLGRVLLVSFERTKLFLNFLINLSVLAVIFGYLERFILGDSFWINIGIREYLITKGMELYAFGPGGLPGNFYTFDYYSIIGSTLRRMASFIVDPTLFGQFLVLPIALLLFTDVYKKNRKKLYLIILISGLLLTLSKGGIFSLAVAILYKLIRSKYRLLGFIAIFTFAIFTGIVLNNAHVFSSLPAHINGLTHNLQLMKEYPFGLGLGQSGNLAALYSDGGDAGHGESFIGLVFGQLGIFSILFLLFLLTLVRSLARRISKEEISQITIVFASVLLGTIASSLISESAISFISAGLLFLMSGIVLSNRIDHSKP